MSGLFLRFTISGLDTCQETDLQARSDCGSTLRHFTVRSPCQRLAQGGRVMEYNSQRSWEDYSYASQCYRNETNAGCDKFIYLALGEQDVKMLATIQLSPIRRSKSRKFHFLIRNRALSHTSPSALPYQPLSIFPFHPRRHSQRSSNLLFSPFQANFPIHWRGSVHGLSPRDDTLDCANPQRSLLACGVHRVHHPFCARTISTNAEGKNEFTRIVRHGQVRLD